MSTIRAAVPDLTRPKNEIVFVLAVIGGALITISEMIRDGLDFTRLDSWYGVAVAALGLVQRLYAFGRQTVAELLAGQGQP